MFNSEKRQEKREARNAAKEERKAVKAKLKETIKPRPTFEQRQEQTALREKRVEDNKRLQTAVADRIRGLHEGKGNESVVQLGSDLLYIGALSDVELQIKDQLNEGNKCFTRWTVFAKHDKEFLGMAPTNRNVEFGGMSISFVDEDLTVLQELHCFDMVALLQQIQAP